jgi:hypothetical protein
MNFRAKSALVLNDRSTEAGVVIFFSLLLAPAVMATASVIERRQGAAAAGWVAALPVSFAVAVVAVTLEAGTAPERAMALSAAAHVPAQVAFAVAFAAVLTHRGLFLGVAAGALVYVACSVALADAPNALMVTGAIPALALAPRVMTDERARPGSPRRWPATVITSAAASAVVGAAIVTTRLAGPEAAGAVAAFPTMSTALAVAVVTRDGASAGAHALAGLVRSLPCYLAFCLVVVLAAPSFGVAATALGLLACVAAAATTWRAVPVTRRPALAR